MLLLLLLSRSPSGIVTFVWRCLTVSYGVVVGVGALFALSMILVTRVLSKYLHEEQDSEMYSTANRSVKTGKHAAIALPDLPHRLDFVCCRV